MTLSATSRSSMVSRARYTWPMAPLPRGALISYRPATLPESGLSAGLLGSLSSAMKAHKSPQDRGLDGMPAAAVKYAQPSNHARRFEISEPAGYFVFPVTVKWARRVFLPASPGRRLDT